MMKWKWKPETPRETDEIGNTVDYGVAFAVIESIVVGQRRYLIEALEMILRPPSPALPSNCSGQDHGPQNRLHLFLAFSIMRKSVSSSMPDRWILRLSALAVT